VDYIPPDPVVITLSATNPSLGVKVTVCGDNAPEPDEQFVVQIFDTPQIVCLGCILFPFIFDDDEPDITINNISVNEPVFGQGGTQTATFTVNLENSSLNRTTVEFSTRDFTAQGAASCVGGGNRDYVSRSGVLTILPNTPSGTISVTICGDNFIEPNESFFVDLSNPVNAAIIDGTGQATIRNSDIVRTGEFALSPGEAQVLAGEKVIYTVDWIVPDGRVWRDLELIDFRVRGGRTALWVRWEEAGNTFRLCQKGGGSPRHDGDDDSFKGAPRLRCGPRATPGSAVVLETPLARLHLDGTSVVGSGPTGRSVTLRMTLSFERKAAGHRYGVELAAADDFGNRDDFFRLGTVSVQRR
jgi:hypothetical protein